ncbi:Amyloid protein [Operophtera brumata]|uniref:Amyloid protein n=1 Tax=Operophtera brumata TaxID=104452 RepID=A0A0L7LMJ6_OPEBR|nr:Amyloid protein [Operophtera brumata]
MSRLLVPQKGASRREMTSGTLGTPGHLCSETNDAPSSHSEDHLSRIFHKTKLSARDINKTGPDSQVVSRLGFLPSTYSFTSTCAKARLSEFQLASVCAEALGASTGAEPQVAVLCESGGTYHPQYMSAAGRWTPDLTTKSHTCLKDKMEILDYCKKVFPSHDITNIVEASHYVKVSNWCKLGTSNAAKCKVTRWVKPFRCLEGPFQSDALLVPESCLFDHIHNQSRCWQFARWNATAGRACNNRGLRLRTFAMLLPCGISLFSGVEFVCCPKHFKGLQLRTFAILLPCGISLFSGVEFICYHKHFKKNVKMHKPMDVGVPVNPGAEEMLAASAAMDERDDDLLDDDDALDDDDDDTLNLSDDDDDDDTDDDLSRDDDAEDDDYTDGDDNAWPRPESSQAPSTTTPTTTTTTTTTITKVMKDWSELEDRYQQMMATDPTAAQTFRQRMTAKFQSNVQSLEEEGVAERRRLAALHQQRVLAHLAQRRRTALSCYTRSLRDTPPNFHSLWRRGLSAALHRQRVLAHLAQRRCTVLSCYTRSLQDTPPNRRPAPAASADAPCSAAPHGALVLHALSAGHAAQCKRAFHSVWRRGLSADLHQQRRLVRALAAERTGALSAWRRAAANGKEAAAAERTSAADRLQSMQSKDDMAVSLMSMTPEAEELLLDRIEAEVQREQAARDQLSAKRDQRAKQRQEIQAERVKTSNGVKESEETDDEASEPTDGDVTLAPAAPSASPSPSAAPPSPPPPPSASTRDSTTRAQETTSTTEGEGLRAALEHAEERAPPPPAHAMKHELQHSQPGFTVRGAPGANSPGGAGALYPALCVGGAALAAAACVALAVARRRDRAPAAQGFVQVEQTGAVAPTPEERHVANMQINGYENPTYKYFEVKE